jgi:hypothetical protein
VNDGVWLSVSDLAAQRGISKQAVSKRLKALSGRVGTKQEGSRLLVNKVEFDKITGADTDPAQQLRNRYLEEVPTASAVQQSDLPLQPKPRGVSEMASQAFSVNRAKRESYDAELSRIELEEKQGKLVPVNEVENAMVRCATAIVRVIDQMAGKSDDPVVRNIHKNTAQELRSTLAQEMKLLADGPSDDEIDA